MNIPIPDIVETDPCCIITFVLNSNTDAPISYEIDCLTNMLIGAIKEEHVDLFQIPAERQVWTYNGVVLHDNQNLRSCGIETADGVYTEILVTQSDA